MWGGKIRFETPMLFCIAFLFQFLIAGLTGIMLAAVPFDWQLSDSYFVVAHFHYVLVGGTALHDLRRVLLLVSEGRPAGCSSETLGKWHFWLFVIGFHLTFDMMHVPGLLGMPRRIYTYEPGRGWEIWNSSSPSASSFQAVGILVFRVRTSSGRFGKGAQAGNDPWDAWTLEWSDHVAAAGLQLRHDSDGEEPPAAVGPQASRGSRLEVRVRTTR